MTAILVAAGILLGLRPARADVSEVMREIQRHGQARVIVEIGSGAGQIPWASARSVEAQRSIVANAAAQVVPSMNAAQIPVTQTFATLPFVAAQVNQDQLLKLVAMPGVRKIHLVHIEHRAVAQSGSNLERPQVALSDSVASIDVPAVWAAGYEGAGLTVAVIDGAFNTAHPMLSGKVVGEACFSDTSIGPSECASGSSPQIGTGAASVCPSGSTSCDHATNVASIAVGNDGTNFGVARKANLMPINVMSRDSSATDCSPDPAPCDVTDSVATLNALDYVNQYATTYHVVSVNMSLGGDDVTGYCDDDPRKPVIDALRANGIAVAIAAGNDYLTGQIEEPSCISSSIAVGATDDGTDVASFSNFATTVDLMAPGVDITAAGGTGSEMIALSGTSMATPHVAGAWALLHSAMPNDTADQLEDALKISGQRVTRTDAGFTVPRIDVMQAVNYLTGNGAKLFNQVVSSAGVAAGQAFLRVYNNSASAGTLVATIYDPATAATLGTWTSPPIAANAAPQISIATIEANAVPASGQTIVNGARTSYNIGLQSSFPGYVQTLLWASNAGVFGNLTSCNGGLAIDDSGLAVNVHASSIGNYVSHLRITNTGPVAGSAVLNFVNAGTGAQVASWTSAVIPPNGSIDVTEPSIEAVNSALAAATAAGASQYNVTLTSLSGYLEHVIENKLVSAFTDMTGKCELSASNAVPAPTTTTTTTATQ